MLAQDILFSAKKKGVTMLPTILSLTKYICVQIKYKHKTSIRIRLTDNSVHGEESDKPSMAQARAIH
jgi:hypothetical protein